MLRPSELSASGVPPPGPHVAGVAPPGMGRPPCGTNTVREDNGVQHSVYSYETLELWPPVSWIACSGGVGPT